MFCYAKSTAGDPQRNGRKRCTHGVNLMLFKSPDYTSTRDVNLTPYVQRLRSRSLLQGPLLSSNRNVSRTIITGHSTHLMSYLSETDCFILLLS